VHQETSKSVCIQNYIVKWAKLRQNLLMFAGFICNIKTEGQF